MAIHDIPDDQNGHESPSIEINPNVQEGKITRL